MNPILINQTFDNFEKFVSVSQSWDLDFLQIDSGFFKADLIQYILQDLQFTRAYFNRALDQKAASPKGMWTFAVKASPDALLSFKGHDVDECSLLFCPPGSDIGAISHFNFDILTFSLSEHFLEVLVEKNKLPNFRSHCRGVDIFILKKNDMELIRFLLKRLSCDLAYIGVKPDGTKQVDWLINTISELIIMAVFSHEKSIHAPKLRVRDKAFKRAIRYIHSFASEEITVRQIVCHTGVSERTLEYVFMERLNLSPKKYISIYRLNRVRREIIVAAASNTNRKITPLASKWGFWHMSQFAKDYKKMFGELPSITMKTSLQQP